MEYVDINLLKGIIMKKLIVLMVIGFVNVGFGAGVTVIAHGWNSGVDDWVSEMADAMIARSGLDTTVYRFDVTYGVVSQVMGVTNIDVSGVDLASSKDCEVIVLCNWSDVDCGDHPVTDIAGAIVRELMDSRNIPNWDHPLVQLPIHLIGHSRGAALVSEISRMLGEEGVSVDQVTFLDAQSILNEASVCVYDNVLFADNYFQKINVPNGEFVLGAYNRELTSLTGGYDNAHSDVHLWYHGTIDLDSYIVVDGKSLGLVARFRWWESFECRGSRAGYYYTRLGDGDRMFGDARNGYPVSHGGYGSRAEVNIGDFAWPNVCSFDITKNNHFLVHEDCFLLIGKELTMFFDINAPDRLSVEICLDSDRNPYDGNVFQVKMFPVLYTGEWIWFWDTSDVPSGFEGYVYVKVSDGLRSRYFYAKPRFMFREYDFDINDDGIVNLLDCSILLSHWLDRYSGSDFCSGSDFDYSGSVDVVDLFAFSEHWLEEILVDPDGMEWKYVSDPGVLGHEGFVGHMSKYETTNDQYCQFLNAALHDGLIVVYGGIVYASDDVDYLRDYFITCSADPWSQIYYDGDFGVRFRDGYDMGDHPVGCVSWYGAEAFCDYYGYRLPTEWEWQAVADYRGDYVYGCGPTIDSGKANYNKSNPLGLSEYPYTTPVDYYDSFGYEMSGIAGSMWEWTDSIDSGIDRVLRGGSLWDLDLFCTVSRRFSCHPLNSSNLFGFRVCR